ncbi:MAG: iron-containing alcohol dehydrogenase [Actinobacteria bacterium]|nr:iron-containing alcohol dehydrogenase [Actinomycetota bacterium]
MANTFFYMPGRIVCGPDALSELSQAARLGTRPLLVTGTTFARRSGLLSKAQEVLTAAGTEPVIFDKVQRDPPLATAEAAAEHAQKHKCDFVVGLGGGSPMDVAKGVAVLLTNPPGLTRYLGSEKLEHPAAPVVCIPTTAGTGSEVTKYSVFVDPSTATKQTVAAESTIPHLAILDPGLTVSLPPSLTAETGMDAFSHALESYLAVAANPLSDAFNLQSLEMIVRALPAVLDEPDNLDLRRQMLLASALAGMALNSTGTILNHGMAYALTVGYSVGHGKANALLLPYTIAYLAADYPLKISRVCDILGCEDVEVGLLDLNRRVGIPTSLSEAGFTEDDLPVLAESCQLNCRRVMPRIKRKMSLQDYTKILRRAF